jgi:hypothetical protein
MEEEKDQDSGQTKQLKPVPPGAGPDVTEPAGAVVTEGPVCTIGKSAAGKDAAAQGGQTPAAEESGGGDAHAGASKAMELAEAAMKARHEREERHEKEEQARKLSLLAQIQKLDVGEKAKLARSGDKDCRAILIRDSNKVVAAAVLANPRITIQEIEIIAASRNVGDDILKEVAGNRDWCKSYTVIHALVNNPKTPIPVSLTFIPKLLTRDLRFLAKSKGVPEAVRATAKRLAEKRKF